MINLSWAASNLITVYSGVGIPLSAVKLVATLDDPHSQIALFSLIQVILPLNMLLGLAPTLTMIIVFGSRFLSLKFGNATSGFAKQILPLTQKVARFEPNLFILRASSELALWPTMIVFGFMRYKIFLAAPLHFFYLRLRYRTSAEMKAVISQFGIQVDGLIAKPFVPPAVRSVYFKIRTFFASLFQ